MLHMPLKIKFAVSGSFVFYFLLAGSALLLTGCAGEDIKREQPVFAYPSPPETVRFYFERSIHSSFDVKDITAGDRLRAFATGTMGTATGLGKPWGVAVSQGRIYVTDTLKRAVLMFDVPGKKFKIFGTEGPGALRKPIGIATSSTGEVYVADNTAKRIVVFDKNGKFLRAFGNRSIFKRPSGVAVSPDGRLAYVIDTGGIDTQEHHLYIFDAQTGDLKRTIGTRGKQEGEFNLAMQVTTAKDGTVYVTDSGNFRVQAFTADGNFKLAFGQVGRKMGNFSRPKGIATDSGGNIYVVDASYGNFQIFNDKAQLLMFIGERGERDRPGRYMLPAGIAVDEDGRIYMVDQFHRKVDIFRPASVDTDKGYLSGEHLKKK
jgi:DNA-binding beta-propeller fold protein YncE